MAGSPRLTSPRARLAFTQQLFKPKSFQGGTPKFGCTLLFDAAAQKTPEWAAMLDAAQEALKDKFGAKIGKMRLKSPFLKGDDFPHLAGFPGHLFLRVSTEYAPNFVDKRNVAFDPGELQSEIYSGCYARATLNTYAYDQQGNAGVAFGLGNIQKLGDGDRLGGGPIPAENEFAPVEDDGAALDFGKGGKSASQFARELVG